MVQKDFVKLKVCVCGMNVTYLKKVENVSVWKKDHITQDIFLVQVHIKCASFIKFWK
jgi:hypothetical protein